MGPIGHTLCQQIFGERFVDARIKAASFQAVRFEHCVDSASGHHRSRIRGVQRLIRLLQKSARRLPNIFVRNFRVGESAFEGEGRTC